MNALYCKNCNDIFALTIKLKKCECGLSSGKISDEQAFYLGDYAVALNIDEKEIVEKYTDPSAQQLNKKKIKEEDRTFCVKVIEYFNEKTGHQYLTKFPSTICTLILQRKTEHNATVEDFKTIVDKKVAQWAGDAYMSKFLTPSTLFKKTKFLEYLGEKINGTNQSIAGNHIVANGAQGAKPGTGKSTTFQKFINTVHSATSNKGIQPGNS